MIAVSAQETDPSRWRARAALLLIVAAAAALRLWQIGTGIPFALGSDEPAIMDHVVLMMKTGSLRPPFFDYPGLVFYLQFPVACLRFMYGAAAGEWTSLAGARAADFYLWSRVVTALMGVSTVVLLYRVGLRWGTVQALLAAALLAAMPMHVRESRFVLTDVPMTFFVTLTFLLSVRANEQRRLSAIALAAVAAGLATAIKYTAGVALLMPLLAACATAVPGRSRWSGVALALGCFAVGFVAGAPYVLLDLPGFLNGFAYLTTSYRPRTTDQEYGGWIYLKHLRLNLSSAAFVLMFAGLAVAAFRGLIQSDRVRWLMVAAFPVLFWYSIADRSLIYGRYLLPLVPFVCLLIAIAVVWLHDVVSRVASPRIAQPVAVLLMVLVLAPAVLMSAGFVRTMHPETTQSAAYDWLRANVPAGSRLVIENTALRFPADLYPSLFVKRLEDKPASVYRASGARYMIVMTDGEGTTGEAGNDAAVNTDAEYGQEVARFTSTHRRPGPNLRIIELR